MTDGIASGNPGSGGAWSIFRAAADRPPRELIPDEFIIERLRQATRGRHHGSQQPRAASCNGACPAVPFSLIGRREEQAGNERKASLTKMIIADSVVNSPRLRPVRGVTDPASLRQQLWPAKSTGRPADDSSERFDPEGAGTEGAEGQ